MREEWGREEWGREKGGRKGRRWCREEVKEAKGEGERRGGRWRV